MTTQNIDTQWRVLEDGEEADPDIIIGQDDFAGPASGERAVARNAGMSLAELIRNPDMSVTQAAFIAAPAVYGASLGRTVGEQAVFAALGAAVGLMAYDYSSRQGWVE